MARNINVEDIHFYVVCPVCHSNIGITAQQSNMERNCRKCGKGKFVIHIHVEHGNVSVDVEFVHNNYRREVITAQNITIAE